MTLRYPGSLTGKVLLGIVWEPRLRQGPSPFSQHLTGLAQRSLAAAPAELGAELVEELVEAQAVAQAAGPVVEQAAGLAVEQGVGLAAGLAPGLVAEQAGPPSRLTFHYLPPHTTERCVIYTNVLIFLILTFEIPS